jgi:hypothetical protein
MEKIEVLKLNLELQMFVEQGAIEQLLDREKYPHSCHLSFTCWQGNLGYVAAGQEQHPTSLTPQSCQSHDEL